MSDDEKKVLVNHPDGRICQVPVEVLDRYVVPPERVKELARAAAAESPPGEQPEAAAHAGGSAHEVVVPPAGQSVVFNFYLGPQAKLQMHATGPGVSDAEGADVEGYHMDIDAFGSFAAHTDWRVGPFIDRSGRPGFGPHSHDPASGNAQ